MKRFTEDQEHTLVLCVLFIIIPVLLLVILKSMP